MKSEQTYFMGRFLGPQLSEARGLAGLWGALLWHSWVRGWWPWGLTCGPGLWGSPGGPGRDNQGWWCPEDADAGEYLLVLQPQLYC